MFRKCTEGYTFLKTQEKVNYHMSIDDIKLFAKNEKDLKTRIQTIRIYSQNIGKEFDCEKCTKLTIKTVKRELTEGTELQNQESIRTLGEKENYEPFRILGVGTIKLDERKNKKRVPQKNQETF